MEGPRDEAGRMPVAVLGATGSVGQRFVSLLENHPWFTLAHVCASQRSAGRAYGAVVPWALPGPVPSGARELRVQPCEPEQLAAGGAGAVRLVFSALDSAVAGPIESAFADAGHLVVTNASPHRMASDVPLIVPEVNPGHLDLLQGHGAGGAILANPNCSTIGLALALKPLDDAFGVRRCHVSTLQALSGAGLPGVPASAIADNVLPFIRGEEDKLETEPRKILGRLENERFVEHAIELSAQCTRVAVSDGHTELVSVELERRATRDELIEVWNSFRAEPQEHRLPSAPERPTLYLDDEQAPQPSLHRDLEEGMACSIGRLRPCPLFDWKFVALSHNTLRGAAGGALLVAELAKARGLLD